MCHGKVLDDRGQMQAQKYKKKQKRESKGRNILCTFYTTIAKNYKRISSGTRCIRNIT